MKNEVHLICEKIDEGLFSDEVHVSVKDAAGADVSLFSSDRFLATTDDGKKVLAVKILQEEGDLVLISLPAKAFENGSTIAVHRSQIHYGKVNQEA